MSCEKVVMLLSALSLVPILVYATTSNVSDAGASVEEYGTSWMYFPDGDGVPQIALLQPTTIEARFLTFTNPPIETVRFCLYTKQAPDKCQPLQPDNLELLRASSFDPQHLTKFMVHGWKSSGKTPSVNQLKDQYMRKGEYNVVIVDWQEVADNLLYWIPAMRTKAVGTYVAKMVDFLMDKAGLQAGHLHIIGHSLGAHVAGFTAEQVTKGPISRVTGLDPALPLFGFPFDLLISERLSYKQANFVDVIHTCGGVLGFQDAIGHVDFYPNGGKPAQPGCRSIDKIVHACSHGRAWQYFAASITEEVWFNSWACKDWFAYTMNRCQGNKGAIRMGDQTPHTARGTYYLKTNDFQPN